MTYHGRGASEDGPKMQKREIHLVREKYLPVGDFQSEF